MKPITCGIICASISIAAGATAYALKGNGMTAFVFVVWFAAFAGSAGLTVEEKS